MRKILIPTDFSENGADAFTYALNFIGKEDAKFHLINVIEPIVSPFEIPGVIESINKAAMSEARDSLRTVEAMAEKFLKGKGQVSISTNVLMGPIAGSIKLEAEIFGAEIIIMGTAGEGHSKIEKFIGTVSSAVIRHAPCPVILIPIKYKFDQIDNVIYSTNLDHADAYEIWKATQLLLPHISVIRCIHVAKALSSKNEIAITEFAQYIESNSPTIQTLFHFEESDDVEMSVSKFADEYEAKMIIMQKSRKSLWQRLFGISHTKAMAFQIKIPLLVLNS